jgi:tetratricopeptide (TPR) repeat protein
VAIRPGFDAEDLWSAIEACYERGWTDGLPVVPPTEALVDAMLAGGPWPPDHVLLHEPVRGRSVTAEKAAINAVMAGCRPEYFPVVGAALQAIGDPALMLHGPATSTGGSALMVIVNGPIATRVDFNAKSNLCGPGTRANATIGRVLRLVEFPRALACMGEAIEVAEATGHPHTVAWAHTEAGRLCVIKGDWVSAIAWLERSLDLCRRDGFAYLFPNAATFLGYAYARSGRIAGGIVLLEEAVEQSAMIRYMASHPRGAAHLAEGHLLAGRLSDATREGRRALEPSRRNGQRGFEAEALRILGDVETAHEAPDDEGPVLFHEALRLAQDLGMRPLDARCNLGLGRLLRRTSGRAAADVLARARAMFAEMGMGFWQEQAEAELSLTAAGHEGNP